MKKENFDEMMENINAPEASGDDYKKQFKLILLNTRKSAWIGLSILQISFIFVFLNLMKYEFNTPIGFMTGFLNFFSWLSDHPILWFLGPLILLGAPIIAFIINLLSVLHFYYDRKSHELVFTLKLKFWNLLILVGTSIVLGVMMLYLIMENMGHG